MMATAKQIFTSALLALAGKLSVSRGKEIGSGIFQYPNLNALLAAYGKLAVIDSDRYAAKVGKLVSGKFVYVRTERGHESLRKIFGDKLERSITLATSYSQASERAKPSNASN